MEELVKRVSENLSRCRKSRLLSVEVLAKQAQIDPKLIEGLESQSVKIDLEILSKIADVLGISLINLLDDPQLFTIPDDIKKWFLTKATPHDFEQLRVYIDAELFE